jgi:hypothetical protein
MVWDNNLYIIHPIQAFYKIINSYTWVLISILGFL